MIFEFYYCLSHVLILFYSCFILFLLDLYFAFLRGINPLLSLSPRQRGDDNDGDHKKGTVCGLRRRRDRRADGRRAGASLHADGRAVDAAGRPLRILPASPRRVRQDGGASAGGTDAKA